MSGEAKSARGGTVVPTGNPEEYELLLGEDAEFCTSVVLAIAEIQGMDPMEVPRLYDFPDPESMNTAVSVIRSAERITSGTLIFSLFGCDVIVSAERIKIRREEAKDGSIV